AQAWRSRPDAPRRTPTPRWPKSFPSRGRRPRWPTRCRSRPRRQPRPLLPRARRRAARAGWAGRRSRVDDLSGHLRQRLADGLQGLGDRPGVRCRQLRERHEAANGRGVAVLVEQALDGGKTGADRARKRRVDLLQAGLEVSERLLGAFDIGVQIEEVSVGVALLLAGDLRL